MRTARQTNNIKKLIDYLESLPNNYPHFDMEDWFHTSNPFDNERQQILASKKLSNPSIGDCGCALGHSVAAGVSIKGATSWRQLAQQTYGITDSEFDMVFSGELAFEYNTPKAAARRLRAILPI